ncbi:hypothetical protein NVP1081O_159 [Vibrio phage 1.081.O._10N.286.52.C2]|nr:hypothetical protein NVP1081O_159 [Vibrio phage 1.081.O._10N.286.52.C2]
MTPKSILRAANTVVKEIKVFQGERTTTVVGRAGCGKNAMLMGMLCQRGAKDSVWISTEQTPLQVAPKLPKDNIVVGANDPSLESIIKAVMIALSTGRKYIFIEHMVSYRELNVLEVLEAIVPNDVQLFIGMAANRDGSVKL